MQVHIAYFTVLDGSTRTLGAFSTPEKAQRACDARLAQMQKWARDKAAAWHEAVTLDEEKN